MRFITGLLVTGLLSSSVFKVGAVAPKSEVNDTIVDLRPLVYEQPFQRKADKITDAKWFQMTYVGVPLVIAGLSVKHGSEHFRQLREDFVPNFHYGYDDYLQYAPGRSYVRVERIRCGKPQFVGTYVGFRSAFPWL